MILYTTSSSSAPQRTPSYKTLNMQQHTASMKQQVQTIWNHLRSKFPVGTAAKDHCNSEAMKRFLYPFKNPLKLYIQEHCVIKNYHVLLKNQLHHFYIFLLILIYNSSTVQLIISWIITTCRLWLSVMLFHSLILCWIFQNNIIVYEHDESFMIWII